MRRARTIPILCALALLGVGWGGGACRGDSSGAGDATDPGSLVVRRVAGARLLDAPARGRVCEADSALAIVAVGGGWGGAVALRVGWPPAAGDTFALRETPELVGQAAAAVRQLGDSVASALTARRGTLTIDAIADGRISGSFEAAALGLSGDTVAIAGRFRNVPVSLGACP